MKLKRSVKFIIPAVVVVLIVVAVVVHALPKKKQTNSADAAGNTPVPSEKSPEVNFGVFLVICGILVVLLLLVFLLYQIQQGRHRKRRRKNQSRKVSGDNRNHPR